MVWSLTTWIKKLINVCDSLVTHNRKLDLYIYIWDECHMRKQIFMGTKQLQMPQRNKVCDKVDGHKC